MPVNATDYVKYLKDDNSPFYSDLKNSTINKTKQTELFKVGPYNSVCWTSKVDENWHYMMYDIDQLPIQGWKIHVSANLEDAAAVLKSVSNFLLNKNISFKFVPSQYELELTYSKNADRIEAGKFITIYPRNENEFCELLDPLMKLTSPFEEGPYILNDCPWKESNVYFRYGAFQDMTAIIDGQKVHCIKTPDGKYIEDKRVPSYVLPEFIEEPDFVKINNVFPDKKQFSALDDLGITSAIHFSNSGGIYAGKFKNNDVIIKEGRPNIGLAKDGSDGYQRVENEYKILRRLKDTAGVADVLGFTKIWKHDYLIEEKVNGTTLGEFMAVNYPFPNSFSVKSYREKCFKIIRQLIKLVEQLHNKGVAIVDFQPENIMVNFNGNNVNVRLIDFESASEVTAVYDPNLIAQDYAAFGSATFEDADWYVLNKIAREMFLPVESTLIFSKELEKRQNNNIQSKFGKETVVFLDNVENKCAEHTNVYRRPPFYQGKLTVPKTVIDRKHVSEAIHGLQLGLVDNLEYQSDVLIHGDIAQYESPITRFAIANGSMGVIMAIDRTDPDELKNKKFIKWLESAKKELLNLTESELKCDVGLFTGLSGIAIVLNDLGEKNIARKLMNYTVNQTENLDISLYSGLSGIGLANLDMYEHFKDTQYKEQSIKLARMIVEKFEMGEFDDGPEYEGKLGLLKGWCGAVLFLWKIGIVLRQIKFRQEAVKILDYIIKVGLVKANQGLSLADNSRGIERLLPYLDTGFSGLSLLLIEMSIDDNTISEKYEDIFDFIKEDMGSFCTYQCCLFSGVAGLIVNSNALMKHLNLSSSLEVLLNSLNDFLVVDKENDILAPGLFGVKASMDYETGSAGILLVLDGSLNDNPTWSAWFPLSKDNKLNLFNNEKTSSLS